MPDPEGARHDICGPAERGSKDLANGLEEANRVARAAVMRPVEGTILTVAAAAADAASEAADGLLGVCEAARDAAVEALWRTPDLLPVLAAAGVVDAGGAGLVLLFDSLLHVVDGRALPDSLPLPPAVAALVRGEAQEAESDGTGGSSADSNAPGARGAAGVAGRSDEQPPEPAEMAELTATAHATTDVGDEDSDLSVRGHVLPRGSRQRCARFQARLGGVGDSIVIVGGDGLWNCHIHTDDIGAAIEAALDVGRQSIHVTDLLEQIEEESSVAAPRSPRSTASPAR